MQSNSIFRFCLFSGALKYKCHGKKNCEISKKCRKACQSCRYKKCIRMGMMVSGKHCCSRVQFTLDVSAILGGRGGWVEVRGKMGGLGVWMMASICAKLWLYFYSTPVFSVSILHCNLECVKAKLTFLSLDDFMVKYSHQSQSFW